MGNPKNAVMPIASALWSRRITHLDAVVLSHADADHFNAVPGLLERFSVGVVYVSPVMWRSDAVAVSALEQAIREAGVPLREMWEGDYLAAPTGVAMEVLHPPRDGCPGGDNSNSLVLQVEYAGCRLLLTGDLEAEGLDELLAEQPVEHDVLLAPHHGSLRSRPAEMMAWATPVVVIISAGADPDAERLLAEFSDAAVAVGWTHRDGLICVEFEPGER
jgi:competence protein ComEC